MIWLWLLACGHTPLEVTAQQVDGGVEVRASEPVDRVRVLDAQGEVVAIRRLPAPVTTVLVPAEAGRSVEVHAGGETATASVEEARLGPVEVEVEAPVGQGARPVTDGQTIEVPVIGGGEVEVAVTASVRQAGRVTVRLGSEQVARKARKGERLAVRARLGRVATGEVEAGDVRLRFRLVAEPVSLDEARRELSLVSVTFPASSIGRPDLARPAGRVVLPSRWWSAVLRHTPLGFRPTDPEVPWAWQAITLRNTGPRPLDVVVRSRVLDASGAPAPAFRPRLRAADDGTGTVSVFLRVPAGESATATLPMFVDRHVRDGTWTREITVAPLGASRVLLTRRLPLYVQHGSTAASAGMLVAATAALAGLALLVWRGPRWMARSSTSELTTTALFGALVFGVGAAGWLVAAGVASVLGPFAPLLSGLVDEAFRYALLATLVTLLPRPGFAALALLVGWLLRGFTFGSFSPVDLFAVGAGVFWLESALWLAGLTRNGRWREGSRWSRWLRLSAGFGAASLASSATLLVVHAVLYRLFFAGWYVAMVLLVPGFLYVLVSCGLAVGFAESLRRVEP